MREWLMRFLQRSCGPLMITLAFLPVPLLIAAYSVPEFMPYVWMWPLAYFLLDVLGTWIRGKKRILYMFTEIAVIVGITAFMGISLENIRPSLLGLMYIVLLIIELPQSAENRGEQIHLLKYEIVGVLIHLIAQFLLSFYRTVGNQALERIAPWLMGSFFLFIILGLLLLNGANLAKISKGRLSVSKVMKRKNMLMTLVVAVIAVLIALIPGLFSVVQVLLKWVIAVVAWLGELLRKLQGSGKGGSSSGSQQGEIGGAVYEESSGTPPWLETMITVLMVGLAIAIVVFCVYFLIRKLMVFVRFLGKRMQKYMNAVSEDYIDVITDTRDEGKQNADREKKQKKLSAANVRKLSPAERIRYRYGLLMRKHPEWETGSTARENLTASAAGVYERVRYSSHPVGEAEAQVFDEETKKV